MGHPPGRLCKPPRPPLHVLGDWVLPRSRIYHVYTEYDLAKMENRFDYYSSFYIKKNNATAASFFIRCKTVSKKCFLKMIKISLHKDGIRITRFVDHSKAKSLFNTKQVHVHQKIILLIRHRIDFLNCKGRYAEIYHAFLALKMYM